MSNDGNQAQPVDQQESENKAVGAPRPSRWRSVTVKAARLMGLGYLTVLVALVVLETQLVYPGAYMDGGNEPARHPIASVDYTSSDDVKLQGRLLHRGSKKPIVLFLHGNGEKASWQDQWMRRLADQFDANVMAAEYRGFIADTPKPSEEGVLADCYAAREFLMSKYNVRPDEIILYGRSLGGGCAVALAADGGAKALILERTFDRLVDIAAAQYAFIPVRLLMRNQYDSLERIARYHGPLIQVHGTTDRLIPITNAKRLHESARCRHKHWIPVPGMGHNDHLPARVLAEIARRTKESIE